jgi:hypothetical protein
VTAEDLHSRATQLAEQLIGPLVLGTWVRPIRPLGPELGLEIGRERRILDDELRTSIDRTRLRRARMVVAVDVVPELDAAEWSMAAALNDLLQVTNEELSSFATRSRHTALLEATCKLCDSIAPPQTLDQAVARHATFGRVLDLCRTDTLVSWWTGSAVFRGRTPPTRLQRWPQLRRVNAQTTAVPLVSMADWAPVDQGAYLGLVAALLRCSPLTDLATAARPSPAFTWSSSTLGLAAAHAGCNLALRAFAKHEPSAAVWTRNAPALGSAALQAMQASAAALPERTAARNIALGFVGVLREAVAVWTAEAQAA